MKTSFTRFVVSSLLLIGLSQGSISADQDTWPTWRPTSGNGVADGATPPIEWSNDKNIKWKTEIPGAGFSTPVIWEDKIFLLAAIPVEGAQSGPTAQRTALPPGGNPNAAGGQGGRQRGGGQGGPGGGAFNREELVKEFDKDGDGELNDEEQQAARTALRARRGDQGGGGPQAAGGRGQGGPGGFNREEMMKQFDKDGDGELNDEERAAMRASFGGGRGGQAQGGQGGRQRGGRQRGGGGGASPTQAHQFKVIAVDRSSGEILWEKLSREEIPHEGHHPSHGYADASPVTDGEYLYVSFGSRGFYCYDLDGNLIWEKDLGDMRTRVGFGEGASPALAGDNLIVLWDNEDQSYLIALDKKSGDEVWRQERDERTGWTTPFIQEVDGKLQAIIAGTNATRSYDTKTGELIWEATGLTSNVIPSPVVGHGNVYLTSGYQGRSVQAIKLSSKGDVSDTDDVVWKVSHSGSYVASPVLSEDRLYVTKGLDAYLACFDALTGEVHYQDEELEALRGIYASPLAANGYLYVVGREGTTVVIRDSENFEIVATNKLDDKIDASPVALGSDLFLRGHKYLYCVSDS